MNYSKRLLHYVKYVLGMHRFYYFLKIFNDSWILQYPNFVNNHDVK